MVGNFIGANCWTLQLKMTFSLSLPSFIIGIKYCFIFTSFSKCYFRDYLKGFHKRKNERRKIAKEKNDKRVMEERKTLIKQVGPIPFSNDGRYKYIFLINWVLLL